MLLMGRSTRNPWRGEERVGREGEGEDGRRREGSW